MTPDQRAAVEAKAERALRRGELGEALRALREVAVAFPEDGPLLARMRDIAEALQPAELSQIAAAGPSAEQGPGSGPEHEGERLFELGDFAGATAAYRRALKDRPDSELIRERLAELYLLAQSAPAASPTDRVLPTERRALLHALLDRIASRRRM